MKNNQYIDEYRLRSDIYLENYLKEKEELFRTGRLIKEGDLIV